MEFTDEEVTRILCAMEAEEAIRRVTGCYHSESQPGRWPVEKRVKRGLREMRRILRVEPDRAKDVFMFDWDWPDRIPDWGTGRDDGRAGDWVRP